MCLSKRYWGGREGGWLPLCNRGNKRIERGRGGIACVGEIYRQRGRRVIFFADLMSIGMFESCRILWRYYNGHKSTTNKGFED